MRCCYEALFELYRKELLHAKVAATYPVDQVVLAMRRLRGRLVKGKVALTMAE